MLTQSLFLETSTIDIVTIRTIGGLTVFAFWMKCFYWMKVFQKFAHFVTLITETILGIKTFMFMLFLCICAFANLFFIINNNSFANPSNLKHLPPGGDASELRYVSEFIEIPVLDSLISMYLTGLGEFDTGGYTYEGSPNIYMAWFFFLLATFLVAVVFMNMLIAIMGNTFGEVLVIQDQSALFEQINMMSDFVWLIDLNELFKGQRYIVRVVTDMTTGAQQQNIIEELDIR